MNIASPPETKRRALGKGLDSLLPRVQPPGPAVASHEGESGKPREIPLELIDRNPFQTRSQVDEAELAELAASIVANGVVQPILLRPQPNGRFQLIAGERRWRASQIAKKATIPAILRQVSDEQALEITIVENLQREDLNAMDQARAFERLSTEFHMTQEQIAARTGKDRVSVANFMRLLKLPSSIQAQVESGQLTFGHARALLALNHHPEVEKFAKKVVALSLSVRQNGIDDSERALPRAARQDAQAGANCGSERPRSKGTIAAGAGTEGHHRRSQRPRQGDHRILAPGRIRRAAGAVGRQQVRMNGY